MNPDGSSGTQVLTSPGYPSKYANNLNCRWEFKTTKDSRITMVFDSFNIEWSRGCTAKDYLFIGAIAKYTKVSLCGSKLPSTFKIKSKSNRIIVKFVTNSKGRKAGFKALLVAN
jgi:hypothetical protein